jgi:subtilisin family serine protease
MRRQPTRRDVLKGLGAAAGSVALGPRIVGAEPVDGRFIVDTSRGAAPRLRRHPGVTVVHDLDSEIGVVVCRAPGRAMEAMGPDVDYTNDLRIERGVPEEAAGPTVAEVADAAATSDAPLFYDLQWDKIEQGILDLHDAGATGHPDLPNVDERLSTSFVPRPRDGGDNFGAGPLADDHGTHVAGTAAASGNVVGVAPDAEIVDIRVFSGPTATFGDIIRAVAYGTEIGCDVLNLSLGSGPLLPVPPGEEITGDDDPDGDGPIVPVPADGLATLVDAIDAVGRFAVGNGTLPVAAAGNDGVNLDRTFEAAFDGTVGGVDFDGSPVSLPNEGEGFVSVAAAGPIGYGWPGAGDDVAGLPFEADVDPELWTEEPAVYTNYGPGAVDVSAAGGNYDIDAIEAGERWFYDLVFSTAFVTPQENIPEDTQLGNNYEPAYGWKAGTSFAAPNVTGLAALLAAADPGAGPEAIRERIEETAVQVEVGLETSDDGDAPEPDGETTAPAQGVSIDAVLASGDNVALDGAVDGDDASSPDSVDLDDSAYDGENFRGEGHVDVAAALEGFGAGGSSAGASDSGGRS